MNTLSGEATMPFHVCFLINGINSFRKEFAPKGANSFRRALIQFLKGFFAWRSKQEVIKFVSFCNKFRKHSVDFIHLITFKMTLVGRETSERTCGYVCKIGIHCHVFVRHFYNVASCLLSRTSKSR